MLVGINYNRERAMAYARKWAFRRNPIFENYTGIGGDCTNFVSQCIYTGCCVMNFTPTFGWYYISPINRAAAWTGVEFFYNFITANEGAGPYGYEVNAGGLIEGDVIQLENESGIWYHSFIVTGYDRNGYLVASHSNDALDRPLSSYNYYAARFIHIEEARLEIPDMYIPDCFEYMMSGGETEQKG